MNRQQWNLLATQKTSEIVGGDVEVTLMKDTISIYSEDRKALDLAVSHYEKAGAVVLKETYYDEEEDMPEGWMIEIKA